MPDAHGNPNYHDLVQALIARGLTVEQAKGEAQSWAQAVDNDHSLALRWLDAHPDVVGLHDAEGHEHPRYLRRAK